MVDIKEIKSVKLAPFTLMASSISAILAFIGAILYLILFSIVGAFLPNFGATLAWVGVAFVIILPIAAFFIGIATNFFSVFLYNNLVPRLGGIKLGLEGSDVTELPVASFAFILAVIEGIWAFIVGLFLAAALVPFTTFLSSAIPLVSQSIANTTNITNTTGAAMPTGSLVGAAGVVGAIFLIIGLPILVFIVGFIFNALAAIFYNYIATKASKVKLEFAAVSEKLFELKTIPVVPAALAVAIVMAVIGLIIGIINLIRFSALGYPGLGAINLISSFIGYFIQYFIVTAIAAFFYNFLVPRIGGIKLKLE
ncbi:MAG TPA: hypothetical protein VMC48_05450 [Methanobacterium sp.]|nr:hypothetical protein [Methanobacterium sp.]